MSIFTHVTVGTNDLQKARSFYDNVLGALGQKRIADLDDNGSIWGESAPSFFVLKPANGAPASVGNGVTVSFEAPDRAAIDAFHAAALDSGGTCEGAPGPRGWAPTPMPLTPGTWTVTSWPRTVSSLSKLQARHQPGRVIHPNYQVNLRWCRRHFRQPVSEHVYCSRNRLFRGGIRSVTDIRWRQFA